MRVRYTDFVRQKKGKENNTVEGESGPKTTKSSTEKLKFIAGCYDERSTLSLSYQYNQGAYNFIRVENNVFLPNLLIECFIQQKATFETNEAKENKIKNSNGKKKNKMLCAFSINFLTLLLLLFSFLSSLSSSNHFIPFHGIFFYFCRSVSFFCLSS
jgi:hypothetical protein